VLDRELALYLDLVLEGGSRAQCIDLLSGAKLDSVAECIGVNECNRQANNKEAKQLVDVAPYWGEPHISGILWFSLCNVISIMFFLVLRLDV
jgi:hypothetical protein